MLPSVVLAAAVAIAAAVAVVVVAVRARGVLSAFAEAAGDASRRIAAASDEIADEMAVLERERDALTASIARLRAGRATSSR